MKDLLLFVGIVLLIGWLIGWIGFGTSLGLFIHILLVLAVIAILLRIIGWGFKGKP